MADAKLTPRQLVDVLHRLDAIESHSRHVRQQVIEAMADRRRGGTPAVRQPGNGDASGKKLRKTRGT